MKNIQIYLLYKQTQTHKNPQKLDGNFFVLSSKKNIWRTYTAISSEKFWSYERRFWYSRSKQ